MCAGWKENQVKNVPKMKEKISIVTKELVKAKLEIPDKTKCAQPRNVSV
jgi:hypothetical protein